MTEWWTYHPSDFLLFSTNTYFRLVESYNRAIGPVLIAGLAAGIAIAVRLRRPGSGRAISAVLAACWIWVALAFFARRYASINWGAKYFAGSFLLEGALLIVVGLVGGRLAPVAQPAWVSRLGVAVFFLALFGEPLIGRLSGRPWLQAGFFGTSPDPTTVATLGLLLFAKRRNRLLLSIVPAICAAISAGAWIVMREPLEAVPLFAAVAASVVGAFVRS